VAFSSKTAAARLNKMCAPEYISVSGTLTETPPVYLPLKLISAPGLRNFNCFSKAASREATLLTLFRLNI
jgi:hypothetical protein